ncbi:biopolymer transporter ExbD [Rubinisphaera sp.]|uniref:ExbD/TolR family protein n=1 Tax=Rubinisphaera sp. TaxID=2024857 RepID=UPI000C0DDF44|nr:biopolymer transporter ExbD [Rubinisphaera sp.]MBV08184.1 biopolymer transporter ExbD [Rubinisphaera sp.]HCS53123.1 biopolymer transporter ExbD [Planctomycetaceae bacterium]|tara:strand:+ start:3351 stop:3827 length:477 start_codon:yes stop_codon:yes gene_type:complete
MRYKKTASTVLEPDMTPMIDVVFQLIAFFMLVTNFEQTQADERVKLPSDQLARPPEAARDKVLVVNIGFNRNKQGEKTDPEAYIFEGDELIPVLDYGRRLLEEKRVAQALYGPEGNQEMTIEIRADSETPTGLIQELIKLSQENGFEKFSLRAKQLVK